jgi:hypothetical protein
VPLLHFYRFVLAYRCPCRCTASVSTLIRVQHLVTGKFLLESRSRSKLNNGECQQWYDYWKISEDSRERNPAISVLTNRLSNYASNVAVGIIIRYK